ncbi:MAG TPA: hypothetical protein ENI23_05955 [bacterium]|nr:hypothetical protein [bacterium]
MKVYIKEGPEDPDKVLDLYTRYDYINSDDTVPFTIDMRNKGTELVLEYRPDEDTQSLMVVVAIKDGWEVNDITEFNTTYFSDDHAVGDFLEDEEVEQLLSDMVDKDGEEGDSEENLPQDMER